MIAVVKGASRFHESELFHEGQAHEARKNRRDGNGDAGEKEGNSAPTSWPSAGLWTRSWQGATKTGL